MLRAFGLQKNKHKFGVMGLSFLLLAGCQATSEPTAIAAVTQPDTAVPETAAIDANTTTPAPQAFVATATQSCANPLAGGPPPAPAKGADFAKNAVGKNLARNVGRNLLSSAVGGGYAGAALSSQVVRTEQDLGGKWQLTDGSNNCGCEVQIRTGSGLTRTGVLGSSGYTIRAASTGSMNSLSCTNPQLATVAGFGLGHSFTGYDADLQIKARDGSIVANMKRNGINHFSGSLADGTPVTMWRRSGE